MYLFCLLIVLDTPVRVVVFVCFFLSHSRIFHSYVDVTISGEGLQILTYAWHSWPLSSEGFFNVPHLLRHVYDGLLRGPVPLTPVAERLAVELTLPVLRLRSVATGYRTPISRLRGEQN